jgi:hypothetical protein
MNFAPASAIFRGYSASQVRSKFGRQLLKVFPSALKLGLAITLLGNLWQTSLVPLFQIKVSNGLPDSSRTTISINEI